MAPNHQHQQQPSIRSFFQPKQLPKYAAPPSQSRPQAQPPPASSSATVVTAPPPPAAPPFPPTGASASPIASILPLTTPQFPPAPSPHPCATIVPIAAEHIPALRRINALLLPVNYNESFYAAALDPSVSGLLSRVILWQDDSSSHQQDQQPPKVIGGIVCRIDPSPFDSSTGVLDPKLAASVAPAPAHTHAVYIQSLGLLAPYRSQGIAAAAVEAVVRDAAALTADPANSLNITALYAHVWTENEDGLRWYAARGFARDVVLGGYYFKLRPDTAWIVKRVIGSPGSGGGGGPRGAINGGGGYVAAAGTAVTQALPVATSTTAAAVNLAGFSVPANTTTTTTYTTTGMLPPPLARASSSSNNPTPPISHSASPSPAPSSLSFQNKRPDMEWNDLPEEMVSRNSSRSNLLSPPLQPPPNGSSTGSGASSRSSSTAPGRKKKERAYPAAAFGS